MTTIPSVALRVSPHRRHARPGVHVALLWLANFLPSIGLHLRANQVVTTGSCTGLLFVEPKQRVSGGFLGFGEVSVDLV